RSYSTAAGAAFAGHRVEFTYSDRWQVLEERHYTRPAGTDPWAVQKTYPYVWNTPGYVDDMILRDACSGMAFNAAGTPVRRLWPRQDANFNVIALVEARNLTGDGLANQAAVVERYVYDPYGSFTILNGEHDDDQPPPPPPPPLPPPPPPVPPNVDNP
ncbi:MAG: hypothetical protein ACFCVE_00990, partial [Phycisphaerae bacterium]